MFHDEGRMAERSRTIGMRRELRVLGHVRDYATFLRDMLTGFVTFTRDLTERRQVEQRLQASEQRLRLFLESAKDYIILFLDPEGHILSWSGEAERLKGYKAEEILGKHFSILYPAEDVASGKPDHTHL